MNTNEILKIIEQGESKKVEFKESRSKPSNDVFDSVCAFLNGFGGHLFLGVCDDGTICGIEPKAKNQILNDFVTLANNPQKLNPTFYFSPEVFEIEGKTVIYIPISKSTQVHRSKGKYFVRNSDGDFDITNYSSQVANLYLKKNSNHTENTVYPF